MAITINCACGKTLNVDEKYRGKKAKCPACGAPILVQEAAETAVQAGAPTKPAGSAAPTPAKRKPLERPAAKRGMLPWLAAGGCGVLLVFSCFICGGVGVWYFWLRGPNVGELKFVHTDVQGFITIRVGDIMKNGSVKDKLNIAAPRDKEMIEKKIAEIDKKLGIGVNDIERATFIFRSADNKDVGIAIRSTRALDQKKILGFLAKEHSEKKEGSAKYFVLDREGASMALHFDGDRAALLTENEVAMREYLAGATKPPTHQALARGVQLAAAGKHVAVAAARMNGPLLQEVLPPRDMMPNIQSLNGLLLAAKLDHQLSVEFTGIFSSSDDAARCRPDFDGLQRTILAEMRAPNPNHEDFMVQKFFQSATIEQRGAEIVIKGKTEINLHPILQVARNTTLAPPGQMKSVNNLKQIMLAVHMYHDVYKRMPAAGLPSPMNPNGPSLLSWRVHILPYIEEEKLYKEIRLDEAWDSPHNKQFWNKMPKIYQLPGKPNDGKTYYKVFEGQETAFPDKTGSRMVMITDGTSNTLGVVEAAQPVHWMKPEDIPFRMNQGKQMLDRLGNHWGDDLLVVSYCDGTVRRLRRSIPPMTLQALITRAGGEVINIDDIE
jgi:DNA-directed RNA polymerase subunit RPC12/RpoP